MNALAPDLLYRDGQFRRRWGLAYGSDGLLSWVGPLETCPPGSTVTPLPGRAILPGLVNAHSHAFQRVIRGRTEFRNPAHPQDDFWSWRELMYRAAMGLSPEAVGAVARLVFLEMVSAGITCVGEFHYLHNQPDGQPYADPDELAWRVVEAAEWAGLRLVLLRVSYHRSGFALPPNPRQARFIEPSYEEALAAVERLSARGVATGLAPHSVRAVPREWLGALHGYAQTHGLPFHMHLSEQTGEIEQCRAEYGLSPVQLAAEEGLLDERFTGVHAIHLEGDDLARMGAARINVCSCPNTERNLGDGIVAADALLAAGCKLALGTDSQCQIDLLEDARQLDYHLRLQRRQRAILSAPVLLECATSGGARSLGALGGSLEEGRWADWVEVDLEHPTLATDDPEGALASVVYGLPLGAIAQVRVGGAPRLSERRHPRAGEAVKAFRSFSKEWYHA